MTPVVVYSGTGDRWANPYAGGGGFYHPNGYNIGPEGLLSNTLLLLLMLTTVYWYWLKNPLFKLRLSARVNPFE